MSDEIDRARAVRDEEAADRGCSMSGRACREAGGYGRDGHCEVRDSPCPRDCLKRSLALELGLSEQRSKRCADLQAELAEERRAREVAWAEAERAWSLVPEAPARVRAVLEAGDRMRAAFEADDDQAGSAAAEDWGRAVDTWRACGRPGLPREGGER